MGSTSLSRVPFEGPQAQQAAAALQAGGMAAAITADRDDVWVVDAQPAPGGQIWRGGPVDARSRKIFHDFERCPARFLGNTRVVARAAEKALLCETPDGPVTIEYEYLVLATGARELFLPFPGWTLPGVYGAGGMQALVKGGLEVAGKRIVVSGSGPLLVAVGVALREAGAEVIGVFEQASKQSIFGFGRTLLGKPAKLLQALAYRRRLRAPYRTDSWVVRADGDGRLESVTLNTGEHIPCDALACGYGLVPNLALPRMMGCLEKDGFVAVDELQFAGGPGVCCIGEATGIGGVDKAIAEGRVAGEAVSLSHPPGWLDCRPVDGTYLDSSRTLHETPRIRFAASSGQCALEVGGCIYSAHAFAAAPGGGLDHHRIADVLGNLDRFLGVLDDTHIARHG